MAIPYNIKANVFIWQRHRNIFFTNGNNLRDLSHCFQMDMKYGVYCVQSGAGSSDGIATDYGLDGP